MSDESYEIASVEVVLPLTRDEANAIAETLTLYVEQLETDDARTEQGAEWLLAIRDRIVQTSQSSNTKEA